MRVMLLKRFRTICKKQNTHSYVLFTNKAKQSNIQGHILHQIFQTDRGLPLQSAGIRLLGLGNTNSIHDHKVILILRGIRGNLLQIVLTQSPGTAAFHLFKIVLAADIPHEDLTLDRFYIRTGRNHIHGNGNSGVIPIPEFTQNRFRILGGVSNLFAKFVSLTKLFPDDLNDIIRMTVGLGKDQGFGYDLPPWE